MTALHELVRVAPISKSHLTTIVNTCTPGCKTFSKTCFIRQEILGIQHRAPNSYIRLEASIKSLPSLPTTGYTKGVYAMSMHRSSRPLAPSWLVPVDLANRTRKKQSQHMNRGNPKHRSKISECKNKRTNRTSACVYGNDSRSSIRF